MINLDPYLLFDQWKEQVCEMCGSDFTELDESVTATMKHCHDCYHTEEWEFEQENM